jgi:anti-sigma B factor antagonist
MSHVQRGITVVRFTDTKVIDQQDINRIGGELMEMVGEAGVRKMLLNMEGVRYLSSALLGKLISLHKALLTDKGALKLCNITAPVYEVFEITRLHRLFDIYRSEDEAIEAFQVSPETQRDPSR